MSLPQCCEEILQCSPGVQPQSIQRGCKPGPDIFEVSPASLNSVREVVRVGHGIHAAPFDRWRSKTADMSRQRSSINPEMQELLKDLSHACVRSDDFVDVEAAIKRFCYQRQQWQSWSIGFVCEVIDGLRYPGLDQMCG
jgi:hypothetical protein